MLYYWAFGYRLLPEDKAAKTIPSVPETEGTPHAKMPYSMGIFAFVVIMMVTGALPLTTAAVLGAALWWRTRCMTMKEAFHCIDWVTIFLFAVCCPCPPRCRSPEPPRWWRTPWFPTCPGRPC